jgi:hypothetical protein
MTIKFEVGDEIWYLDTTCVGKSRIRNSIILEIEWEKYYSRYKYVLDDDLKTYIWSPNTTVARTKEELIDILYPPKCGQYEYNQLVYIVETNGNAVGINVIDSLVIDKAYIKDFDCNKKHYKVSDKQDDSGTVITYAAVSIYKSAEGVKQAVIEWLNNNDN